MKQSRFMEQRIIGLLGEHDADRKHGLSSATFYKWKARYSGLEYLKLGD